MGNHTVLISAGEASGDLYASQLVKSILRNKPGTRFAGCAGPGMKQAGVEQVVDAANLNVVGLVEVVSHIPRIYGEFRKLVDWARRENPSLAILTDSPDFHLPLAAKLKKLGIPVVYLVAPQAWAWRQGRVRRMRRDISELLCIFPFEEEFFLKHGVAVTYVGHPLTRLVKPTLTRQEFLRKHRIPLDRPMVVLLPGSRPGEIGRHLPLIADAVNRINRNRSCSFVLATPAGLKSRLGDAFFREPIGTAPIQHIEGETWDAIAHADLALAASGTVTIEAALLGTPMVVFYQVNRMSCWMGRFLVNVPHFSMVNLVAGRRVAPELIQNKLSGETLAAEGLSLLGNAAERERMRQGLAELRGKLEGDGDPMERAAQRVARWLPE